MILHDSRSDALSGQYRALLGRLADTASPGWSVVERAMPGITWCRFAPVGRELPAQGWKVHVSCSVLETLDMYQKVLPRLLDRGITFKVPASLDGVRRLNAGEGGASQVGKILTAYPEAPADASRLAEELDQIWPTSRGPQIPTDITVRPRGAVGLRYGTFDGKNHLVLANGAEKQALILPDGGVEPDDRVPYSPPPAWAPSLQIPIFPPEDADPFAAFSAKGIRLLPLALLQNSPRSRVMLALDLSFMRRVVVKVVRRGFFSDELGRDMIDRLRNETQILRMLGSDLAPAVYELCEDERQAALLLEDLGGRCFEQLPTPEQQRWLADLAQAVGRLHEQGIAHRDLKPSNVIVTDTGVRLLDFEISARLQAAEVFCGGTRGYMPPEGTSGPASAASDLYALGACIAAAYLGCDPGRLPAPIGRIIGLLSLLGFVKPAALVSKLLQTAPQKRPSATVVSAQLREAARGSQSGAAAPSRTRPQAREAITLRRYAARAAADAALATTAFRSSSGPRWRNEHETADSAGSSLSTGAAGILLGLASISHVLSPRFLQEELLEGARWLAASAARPGVDGLWVGNAGAALCLGVLGKRFQNAEFLAAAQEKMRVAARHDVELDLYAGSAGISWTACLLASLTSNDEYLGLADRQMQQVLSALCIVDGIPAWSASALCRESAPLTGVAHGAAGMAIALHFWGQKTGRTAAETLSAEIFRSLYEKARSADCAALRRTLQGAPAPKGDWCHGAAGYLWALLLCFGDCGDFREEIDWAVGSLESAPSIGNPTYCHGLSGRLELWQMLRSVPRHATLARKKANELVAVLSLLRQRTAGYAVFGAENSTVISPSLWVGFLGPATALARYSIGVTTALFSSEWLQEVSAPPASLAVART